VTLDGLDMTTPDGEPTPIIGVIKGDSSFCTDPVVSFDADTVSLTYDGIAPGDSECGDIRSFDLVTVPEPCTRLGLLAGTALLTGWRRKGLRRAGRS